MNSYRQKLFDEILGPSTEENEMFIKYITETLDSFNTINAGLIQISAMNYIEIFYVNKTSVNLLFSLTPELSIWSSTNGCLSNSYQQALVFLNLKIQDCINIEAALQAYSFKFLPRQYRVAKVYNIDIEE